MGNQLPLPKKGTELPNFRLAKQLDGSINTHGMEVGLGRGHIVLDGDPAPTPQKGGGTAPPQFSAHVCCGQMARWAKIPLGRVVGLGAHGIVLYGTELPPPCKKMDTALPS